MNPVMLQLQQAQADAALASADAARVAASAAVVQAVAATAAIAVSIWLTFRSLRHEKEVERRAEQRASAAEQAAEQRALRAEEIAAERMSAAEQAAAASALALRNRPIQTVLTLADLAVRSLEARRDEFNAYTHGAHYRAVSSTNEQDEVSEAISRAKQGAITAEMAVALRTLDALMTERREMQGPSPEVADQFEQFIQEVVAARNEVARNLEK